MKTMKKCISIFLSALMVLSFCAVAVFAAECPHNYEASVFEPTCVEDGYTLYMCSLCGSHYKDATSVVPALGHDFGEWYLVDSPDCVYEGHEMRDCSICLTSEVKTIPVLAHTDANVNGKCDYCNADVEVKTTFAPFDWLVAFFKAIAQWFRDIFA